MLLLAVYALGLAFANASAFDLPSKEIKSRNTVRSVASLDERIRRAGNVEQFPFHAIILRKDSKNESSRCSGSLIANEWVLTAAHCVDGTKEAAVHLGATRSGSAAVIHKVTNENCIIHSDWDSVTFKNDISLIKIPYTDFSEKVQPVKLPAAASFYRTYVGDEVVTLGWCHLLDSAGIITTNTPYVKMSVIPNSQCRKYYGWTVGSSNICIATYGGISSCISDAGSPVVLKSSKTQIGLTSLGSRIAHEGSVPVVFTSIHYYLDWIKENSNVFV